MRKAKLFIMAVMALNLIWGQNLIFYAHKTFFSDKVHLYCNKFEPTTVHVFIDYATTPTLLQFIELLRLPEKDVKFVSWWRHPLKGNPVLKKLPNVKAVSLNNKANWHKAEIQSFIDEMNNSCPNVMWELHFNYKHIGFHPKVFLSLLPVNKIKRLHLYEDGMGTYVRNARKNKHQNYRWGVMNFYYEKFEEKISYYADYYAYLFPKIYPTTMHVAFVDKIGKNSSPAKFENVDIGYLKSSLTPVEKEKIYELFGFDPNIYKALAKDRPIGIYLYDGRVLDERKAAAAKLQEKIKENIQKEKTVWFSKNHPRLNVHYEKDSPFITIKNVKAPFELFLISDLPIKYIAGEGSSAFYSVPRDLIFGYIPNYARHYLHDLLRLGILSKEKIFNWKKSITK